MRREQIVLNTIVYKEQLDRGVKQVVLLKQAKQLGISNVEIRREFLQDVTHELSELKKEAQKLKMTLFYSVNDEVVKKQQVNPKLVDYIDELKQMNGKFIKFNVGNFNDFQGDLSRALSPLIDSDNYEINVENNQILTHSKLSNIVRFMKEIERNQLDIGFVTDIANWCWINEDPEQAIKQLDFCTRYVHAKNFLTEDDGLLTQPLANGELEWRSILERITNKAYLALEFPSNEQEILATLRLLETIS